MILYPVTTVGSWPRSEELLRAQKLKRAGRLSSSEFDAVADREVEAYIQLQEEIGVDIVTDGEQRRDNFYSFVAEKLEGVQLMTLGEMLDLVEDKAGFQKLLDTLDVPTYAISNPTCVGRLGRKKPLAVDEAQFARRCTDRRLKVPLPGPYILTRALWVPEATGRVYHSKEELGEVVVEILRHEVQELASEGVDFIQFDEPVLTELVFTQGSTRTFMCAALATRKDPTEELEFAVSLINRVTEGIRGPKLGVHVCRGNWSTKEEILLKGAYRPLIPIFERLTVDQMVLEYATPRAGDLIEVPGKELGLGVVNPRTENVETVEDIVAKVREAARIYGPERLYLNPDCGFATFSMRPMNGRRVATEKLRAMVGAARILRSEFAVAVG